MLNWLTHDTVSSKQGVLSGTASLRHRIDFKHHMINRRRISDIPIRALVESTALGCSTDPSTEQENNLLQHDQSELGMNSVFRLRSKLCKILCDLLWTTYLQLLSGATDAVDRDSEASISDAPSKIRIPRGRRNKRL